jgi:hypothetical protein
MDMQVVKLSSIVMKLTPELYSFLKPDELDCPIVLRNGLDVLDSSGALEIIQQSIFEHQKVSYIH